MTSPATIVVHGGAGRWTEHRERGRDACLRAARAGQSVLRDGGTAVDAAIAAVVVLEDDPACNAGTGAVLRSDGSVEHDASVMDGLTRTSGALGSLRGYKNPILIAEQVRSDGRFHLLVGDGAASFAKDHEAVRAESSGPTPAPAVDRGETVG
ncbi:MAG TPA: isoaspartyl peptidase/L-asparaginase, partial [Acidimicrobiales bacterium]